MFLLLVIALAQATGALDGDAADCPATPAALIVEIEAAETAYADLREDRFLWHRREAERLVTCLNEPLSPALAARFHLLEILGAWLSADRGQMLASIRGLLTTDPDYQPDSFLAPAGSSLRRTIDTSREDDTGDRVRQLPVDRGHAWVINGHTDTRSLPLDRATLVQRLDPGADHPYTWYLPGDPPASALPEGLLPAPRQLGARALGAAAIVCGAAAVGTFTVAALSAPERIGAPDSAHRAAGWSGLGLSVGALGMGTIAVIRWGNELPRTSVAAPLGSQSSATRGTLNP
jgi:hypothetical protein